MDGGVNRVCGQSARVEFLTPPLVPGADFFNLFGPWFSHLQYTSLNGFFARITGK